jgi:biotin synthase-related radical SAM superfamily protein
MNRLRKQIEIEKEFAREYRRMYCPNSIDHMRRPPSDLLARTTLELARLQDFLEWLFDHSIHCDHISYEDAFHEFEEYERPLREKWNRKQ